MNIVTRFAPSPTGFMHIGGARTALFAYLFAKRHGGTFILRIEDTDQERRVEGSIEHIQETLRWLGIEWDMGPDKPGPFGSCIQSERLATYRAAAELLIEKGLAYPDPYSAEEVEAFRKAAHAEKRPFLFRDHRPKEFAPWDGKRPLRFKVPTVTRMRWHDAVRGDLEAGEEAVDDFILIKADGYPTYNLAHIVDDHAMGVTHIMRADEFISSTPRFLSLYEGLGYPPPVFVTLPPILREDRTKKLGKRDGAKDILEYRADGYLPEAMVNFLALTGWNPGTEQEIFSQEELISAFTLEGIQAAGAVLNEEKLLWFNRQHLLRLSDEVFMEGARASIANAGVTVPQSLLTALLPLLRERTSTWRELEDVWRGGEFSFFIERPKVAGETLLWKGASAETTTAHLHAIHSILREASEEAFHTPEGVKDLVFPYAEAQGKGAVLWPLRVSLTGREKSPDPFTVASVVGKDEVLARIHAAIQALEASAV